MTGHIPFFAGRRKQRKGVFFRKSFLMALSITCLPIALIGFILYFFGYLQIEKQFVGSQQFALNQATQRIDQYFSHFELTSAQWMFNPIFDDDLNKVEFREEFSEVHNLYRTLSVMVGSDPLIDDVQLYLAEKEVTVSNEKGIVPIVGYKAQEAYRSLMKSNRAAFWSDGVAPLFPKEKWFPYSLVLKLPGGSTKAYGALIVYLNSAKVADLVGEMVNEENGSAFLLNDHGGIISASHSGLANDSEMAPALRSYISAHFNREMAPQEQIFHWNNQKYALYNGMFNRLGTTWNYAAAVSSKTFTAPVLMISRLMIGIIGAVFCIAVLLSWLASLRLYRPIQKLLGSMQPDMAVEKEAVEKDEFAYIETEWRNITRESHVLQTRINQQFPVLRGGFLLQLMQGHLSSYSESDLKAKMEQLGWDVGNKQFAVLVVQLSGFFSLAGRFSEGDEPLVSFAVANIAEELSRRRVAAASVVQFQDLSVGLWLSFPSDYTHESIRSQTFHLCQDLIASIQKVLPIQITISISKLTGEIGKIPSRLEQARRILRFRDVQQSSQIIDVEDILPEGGYQAYYPFDTEKEIIQAIRIGIEQESIQLIERFMEDLRLHTGKELLVKQGMMQLLGNIQYSVLQSGFDLYHIYQDKNLFEQLNQLHEPEEMIAWFKTTVIQPYISELNRTQNLQTKQLVEKVITTIHQRYMDDISLEQYADMHGTYAQKLSMGFKQITGLNFIDYVTNLRLEKSKELLRESGNKIHDIAGRVGYQPSYFNRIFKKREGITPGQYRELYATIYHTREG